MRSNLAHSSSLTSDLTSRGLMERVAQEGSGQRSSSREPSLMLTEQKDSRQSRQKLWEDRQTVTREEEGTSERQIWQVGTGRAGRGEGCSLRSASWERAEEEGEERRRRGSTEAIGKFRVDVDKEEKWRKRRRKVEKEARKKKLWKVSLSVKEGIGEKKRERKVREEMAFVD